MRGPRFLSCSDVESLTRLALAARAGDPGALDSFLEAGYPQVWQLCASLVDADGADDLAQETFVRAVRSLPSFRAESTARTWLLAIARHVCLDELRRRSRRRRLTDRLAETPEPVGHRADEEPLVRDLLARLEPDRRLAFVLTQLLGLSYDEAARVSDCPVGTIRSRVARARTDLLAELAAVDEPPGHRRHRTGENPA